MQILNGQVLYVAELVKLLEEVLEILWIVCVALRDVEGREQLILHQDILYDFSFELGYIYASQLENAQSATFIQNCLTYVIEAFWMFENDIRDIQLPDAARVCEGSADGLAVDFFVPPYMLEGKFLELLVLLDALQDFLEVDDVFEGNAAEAQSLEDLLGLHEFREGGSCFT